MGPTSGNARTLTCCVLHPSPPLHPRNFHPAAAAPWPRLRERARHAGALAWNRLLACAHRRGLHVRSVATFSAGGPSVDCLCEGWFLVRLRSLCSCQQPATCDGVCEVKSAGLSCSCISTPKSGVLYLVRIGQHKRNDMSTQASKGDC
ncbi:unnamed protein product [Urochloa humidicola]